MPAELRRFPRFDLHVPGVVELTAGDGAKVAVDVVCVSCEGAGVAVTDGSRSLLPGALVRLRFKVPGGADVVLPASVRWAAAGKAGLHLRLPDCEPESRQAFGSYIAPLTKDALHAARGESPTTA